MKIEKIKFNKKLVLKLKFYAESIVHGIKHVCMLLSASELILFEYKCLMQYVCRVHYSRRFDLNDKNSTI